MPNRETILELVVTVVTIFVLATIVFFASAYGARGLSEFYEDTDMLGAETLLAISAYRWTPFLFATILIGYIWSCVRQGERRWASLCALSVAALTTAFVLYGIVRPFASTTFHMGNQ